ncbi:MAG: DegV family protein [Clostridiales bacterium]|nr:DegV family protein [Clostridiales bacterium]
MVKIIVDSASDVEKNEAEEFGVSLIPLKVRFGEEEFSDGIDLTHKEFFEKLVESAELPQTSQINEYNWEESFKQLTADGSDVIAITISSKLSGTYSSAVRAAKKFNGKVYVVDSIEACIGERILLQYAIRLVNEDKLSASEIVKELNDKKNKIQLLAVLDTLKYLRKGGRISSVAAIAGELLSIKPVISIVKGEIKLMGKAMGSKKSNNLLNQLVEKCGGIDFDMPYALAYSGLSDNYLQKYLSDSEHLWKGKTDYIPSYMIGSTIGTHVGPNAIAVAFFAK